MFLRALTRSLARRPKRFAVAVVAVAMGVGMAVALASVSLVLGDRLGETVRQYGANLVIVPQGGDLPLEVAGTDVSAFVDAGALPESTLAAITTFRWRNNVLGYAPQNYATARVRRAGGVDGTVAPAQAGAAPVAANRAAVVGTWFRREVVDVEGARRDAGMLAIASWWRIEGAAPADDSGGALVGRALAARLGVVPGDAIDLALEDAQPGAEAARLPVTGVLDAGGLEDDQLYVPLAWLQRATARGGQVARVFVSALVIPGEAPPMPDPARDLEGYERWACQPYAETIALELGQAMPGATVRPVAALVRGEERLVGRLNLLMLLLTGAALTAASLGVMSTMVASVVDRTHEVALLRALGATRRAVARLFVAEALVVAVTGGILGVALGFVLAQVVGRGAFDTAVEPHPVLLPVGLALAALVCLVGSWLPLRRIAAIDPATTLRPGA